MYYILLQPVLLNDGFTFFAFFSFMSDKVFKLESSGEKKKKTGFCLFTQKSVRL